MNPKRSGRYAVIADRASRRHHHNTLPPLCKTCKRPVGERIAASLGERLANMGCDPETIEANSPICAGCVRNVIRLACELHEEGAA